MHDIIYNLLILTTIYSIAKITSHNIPLTLQKRAFTISDWESNASLCSSVKIHRISRTIID